MAKEKFMRFARDNKNERLFYLMVSKDEKNWKPMAKGGYYPLTDIATNMLNNKGFTLIC